MRQLQNHRRRLRRRAARRPRRGAAARLVGSRRRGERRPRDGGDGRGDDRAAPRHPQRRQLQDGGVSMLQWLAQFLAAPVVNDLWKVIVWDIVLGLGSTDPIGGDVGAWAGMIVTAYVGGRSLEK